MTWAFFGGVSIVIGFLCLLINLVQTLGFPTLFRVVTPRPAVSHG